MPLVSSLGGKGTTRDNHCSTLLTFESSRGECSVSAVLAYFKPSPPAALVFKLSSTSRIQLVSCNDVNGLAM